MWLIPNQLVELLGLSKANLSALCPQKEKAPVFTEASNDFVGVAGFEPAASCSQSRRDTGLRYTPMVSLYEDAKLKNKNAFQNGFRIFFLNNALST